MLYCDVERVHLCVRNNNTCAGYGCPKQASSSFDCSISPENKYSPLVLAFVYYITYYYFLDTLIPKIYVVDKRINNFRGDLTDASAKTKCLPQVAITSQEDSTVWVGFFDWDTLEFVDDGVVLFFPRGGDCQPIYCNVEGIEWIDECVSHHQCFCCS